MSSSELEMHKQFLMHMLTLYSATTQSMSTAEKEQAADWYAEHILLWVTSRPAKRSWWRRLVGDSRKPDGTPLRTSPIDM